MSNEETLPEGTDATELMSTDDIHDVSLEFNGKMWKFKFRELTWKENLKLVATMRNESTNMRNGVTTTTTKYWAYMETVYTKCCEGCPNGFIFSKCKADMGNKIMQSIPGFSTVGVPEDISESDIKN